MVLPLEAYDKNVTWISNETLVAIVNDNRKVTAIAPGSVVITTTTNDGDFTDNSYAHTRVPNFNIKVYPVPSKSGDLTIELGPSGSSGSSKISIRALFR